MRPYSVTDLAALVAVEPTEVASVEAVGYGAVTVRTGEFLTSVVVRNRQVTVPTGPAPLGPESVIEAEGELQFGVRTRGGEITWTPPLAAPEPEAPAPKRRHRAARKT